MECKGTTLLVTWCIYTLLLELGYITVTSGTKFTTWKQDNGKFELKCIHYKQDALYVACKGLHHDQTTYTSNQHNRIKIIAYLLKIFNENSNGNENYSLNLVYPCLHVLFTHT